MLRFPIESEAAIKFWASANICNRVRAICAFSLDEHDAQKNLDRFGGYQRHFRMRVLNSKGITYNNPTMVGVPFNDGSVPIWECLDGKGIENLSYWDDSGIWVDNSNWKVV